MTNVLEHSLGLQHAEVVTNVPSLWEVEKNLKSFVQRLQSVMSTIRGSMYSKGILQSLGK